MENTYSIDTINKQLVLEFDKDNKSMVDDIKKVSFSSRYNPVLQIWIIPVDIFSKSLIFPFLQKWRFKHRPSPKEVFEKYDYSITKERTEELERVLKPKNFTFEPRHYQLEALNYGLEKMNFINGDDVGIGKTFESILYAEFTDSWPCIVICPASVKYNWFVKWKQIVPQRTISVIESTETKKNPRRWDTDVVIINYDIIGKKQGKGATVNFLELATTRWKMFIFDEAHFLKEEGSQRTKVARQITKISSGIIQLLTGTATMSRPSELWYLLVLIKKSNIFANSFENYIQRYCNGHKTKYGWDYSGSTDLLGLNKKLRDNCYLRREKRDVLLELPPVSHISIEFPISNKKEIEQANTNFLDYLYETKGEEAVESALSAETLVKLGVLRKLAIQGKIKAIEQYLKDWQVGGKKLIVFGIHREELDYLSNKFESDLLAGGVTAKKKQEMVQRWIQDDKPFLFANISSGGTGVDDLQKICSNILVIEYPWRPSDVEQLVGRIDRSEQTDPCTIRYAHSDLTIDKQMWKMLSEKEFSTKAANQGIDIISEKSGMRTVMRMLVEDTKNK